MDFKNIRKSAEYFVGWLGLNACSLIIKIIPEQCIYGFARILAALGYRFASKQRRIALESLAIAFGKEKTPRDIEEIARDCFSFMAKSAIEVFFLMNRPKRLKNHVQIIGKGVLDAALARGNGAILVSAHFGNFPLMLGRLSLDGYKTAGIMRSMRDKRVERLFLRQRTQFNIRTIYSQPRKACVEETIRSLRNNELVFIPVDQNFGTGGVFVDFFGQKAATATGPIVLAQRTKAAIIPCFIIRQKDDTHKAIFEPALNLEEAGTTQETVIINIQKLTNIIESYIRRYPAEWGWIHRRWKSRPNQ